MMPKSNPGSVVSEAVGPLASEFAGDPEMRELIEMFVSEMPEKTASLEALWRDRQLEPLKRLAHQIKGAGGGYGYSQVSQAAGKLESQLQAVLTGPAVESQLRDVQARVEELIKLCRRVSAGS